MNQEHTPAISAETLDGQVVAVILVSNDSRSIMYGTARSTDAAVIIEMDRGGSLPIPEEVMLRVQRVKDEDRADPDLAGIVEDAAFLVSMTVGNVSDEDAEAQGMIATGIRLPSTEDDE